MIKISSTMPFKNDSETSKRADCQNVIWYLNSVRANIIDKLKHANAHPRKSILFYHHTSQYLVGRFLGNRSFRRTIQFNSPAFGRLDIWRWIQSIFSMSIFSFSLWWLIHHGVFFMVLLRKKCWSRSTVQPTQSYANKSWRRERGKTSSSNAANQVK